MHERGTILEDRPPSFSRSRRSAALGERPKIQRVPGATLLAELRHTELRHTCSEHSLYDIKAAFGRKLQPQRMVTVTLGAAAPIPQ